MAKQITEKHISEYKILLDKKGEEGFYRHAVATGIKLSVTKKNPEIDMLELSDACLLLNRQTGEELYSIFSRIFRRAAHTLFRQFNKEEDKKVSKKFLRAV
jgi:hypothetical protein